MSEEKVSSPPFVRPPMPAQSTPLLLRNIAVIDGLGNAAVNSRDVLVVDGRIAAILATGDLAIASEDIRVIDGTGLTVMPGLIDLHVHLGTYSFDETYGQWQYEGVQRTLNAHLFAGVTTVLDLGNDNPEIFALRDQLDRGERLGPTVIPVGASIDRITSIDDVFALTSPSAKSEIERLLDERQDRGLELVKIYAGMSNWSARHFSDAAHDRGMRVIADFWCANLHRTTFEITQVDAFVHGACRKLTQDEIEYIVENDKFVTMTLTIFDLMGGYRVAEDLETKGFAENPMIVGPHGSKFAEDYYRTFDATRQAFFEGENALYTLQLFPDLAPLLRDNQANVLALYQAGALIGLGTDANFPPGNFPGDALHHEMLLHVEAGIPPIDVIQMATFNAARILKKEDEFGSVAPGLVADLLVVRGDPSTDISVTREIAYVIKAGQIIDRTSLTLSD